LAYTEITMFTLAYTGNYNRSSSLVSNSGSSNSSSGSAKIWL